MQPRLSLVTLAVSDMARSRAFYEALGFKASSASRDTVTFFDAGGTVLGLYGRGSLAEDAGVPDSAPGFSGVALAHNTRTEAEVDEVLGQAVAAGAKLIKPGQKVFWGGYSGYFADPDGHLWEVAFNPFVAFDSAGRLRLPGMIDHAVYDDTYLRDVLKEARVFAVVGASAKPSRPSYQVMEYLLSRGLVVIPVNPGQAGGEILGQKVYARLSDIPELVDIVDVFRKSEECAGVVGEAIAEKARLGIRTVWMQQGVRSEEAAHLGEAAGLNIVMDRCVKIEIGRLGG